MSHLYTKFIVLAMVILFQEQVSAQLTEKIKKEAGVQTAYALDLCKQLHKNPELAFQELETSQRMAAELEKAGLTVTSHFGGNSVVGILKNGDGPVVMLRTDMDALPLEEKTGLEFASTKKVSGSGGQIIPVMHACGHDIHMSVLVGTIRALKALKSEWKGTLMVITQQAEEVSGGAGNAIDAGLFSKFPTPACALAFHINPDLEAGTIGLVNGPVFAGVRTVDILVHGKGGHGAYPEKCIDPIVIASRIVLDLQTIVSRETSPFEPVVVTVGSIHGGTRPNIIPDEVKLELTLRYYAPEVLQRVIQSIQRISRSAAQMAGMPENKLPDVVVHSSETPPVLNDGPLCERLRGIDSEILEPQNVVKINPSMVGEDFGKYGLTPEKVPICLIWLGSTGHDLMQALVKKGERPAPLHSQVLNPDYSATIETGIKVMTGNVIGLTRKH